MGHLTEIIINLIKLHHYTYIVKIIMHICLGPKSCVSEY